jgi:hypothetical protein
MKKNIKTGINEITKKDTCKRAGGLLFGSFLGSVAVMLTDRLTSKNNKVLQYGAGTLSSGTVAVLALGMGYENIGLGSAIIGASQAINTATSLVFKQNVSELTN